MNFKIKKIFFEKMTNFNEFYNLKLMSFFF